MKIIAGRLNNKTRILTILTVFALLASALSLATVAYQRNAKKSNTEGDSYLYQAYEFNNSSAEKPVQKAENGKGVLVLGKDYDSNRTDAIICVYFNYETGAISTLQIPRDTYVTDGDYKGRINTLLPRYRSIAANDGKADALEEGIHRLMQKISDDFGVKLDNYVFLDCAAISALTDALGGVTLEIPAVIDYTNAERGIDLHLKEGMQHLNGTEASQFVRYRQGYPQADMGRINAQKLYASAMIDKIMALSSPTAAISVANAMLSYIKTDIDAETAALLTTKLCLAKKENVVMYTAPGDGVIVNGASYYGIFVDKLETVLKNGFNATSKLALKAEDFSHLGGGYTDTDGVKLSSVLEHGLSIPVYAN